jgi:hypothetical protein
MPSLRSLLLAFAVLAARAEEALVLDNGAILQGTVVREESGVLHFRLSGVGTDSRIEIRRDRVVKRFTTVDPTRRHSYADLAPSETPTEPATSTVAPTPAPLPAEEPEPSQETFFARFLRLAALAFPTDVHSRVFLVVLGLVVVLCLVAIGGRVADLEGLTLGKSTALALFFAAIIAADVHWAETLIRADRAPWVIPLQLTAWVGLAMATVRCGFGRAVMLLAFVIFTGGIVTFASGALLVTV